jgi:hypothetical protein
MKSFMPADDVHLDHISAYRYADTCGPIVTSFISLCIVVRALVKLASVTAAGNDNLKLSEVKASDQ